MRLPVRRDTQAGVGAVREGDPGRPPARSVVSLSGTTDVLRAEVGDVVFLPANVEHSFMSVGETGTTAVLGMSKVG